VENLSEQVDALFERTDSAVHEIFHRMCDMEQIQKQKHKRRSEEITEDLPDPIDESEIDESTKRILARIASNLSRIEE
jgi:hypothetical protein